MSRLLSLWLINAIALLALPQVVPTVEVDGVVTALWVALVLGLINTLLRPLLILLTLPVTLLSLGLFIFVINALLFQLAGELVSGFHTGGFLSALIGSIVYSIISWALTTLFLRSKG